MGPVRIAHVISALELYGKEKWLLAFLKYLDRSAYSAIVIILGDSRPSRLFQSVSELGIPCYTIDAQSMSGVATIRKMRSIIDAHEIRIVHSHDYKSDVMTLGSCRSRRCKTISTPHGWSNEPDAKLQLYQLLDKCIFPFFDKIAPLSDELARGLRYIPGSKLALIRNFIDIPGEDAAPPVRGKLISCIGRLTALKRFEDVIEALRYVKDSEYAVQLIGDGPERSRLEKLARECDLQGRVSFLGFRDDALDLLKQSAILVHPSTSEGISRVVMEAMALGKVVIGTEIPGISILIKSGTHGLLVPPKDPRAIAAALDWVAENPSASEEIGMAARKHIIARHSAPVAVKEYEALYAGIMAGGE